MNPCSLVPDGVVLVPYGLSPDGELRHIDQVARGASCACFCPGCRGPLIAKKGAKMRPHFAHQSGFCSGGALESAAHLLAKKALAEARDITIPEVVARIPGRERLVAESRRFHYDAVWLEEVVGPYRADGVVERAGHRLVIEFHNTHAVDDPKRQGLIDGGVPAIEIDISRPDRWMAEGGEADHCRYILHEAPRQWLFNRLMAAAEKEMAEKAAREQRELAEWEKQEHDRYVASVKAVLAMPPARANPVWALLVEAAALEELLDEVGRNTSMFRLETRDWQAAVLHRIADAAADGAAMDLGRVVVETVLGRGEEWPPLLRRAFLKAKKGRLAEAMEASPDLQAWQDELKIFIRKLTDGQFIDDDGSSLRIGQRGRHAVATWRRLRNNIAERARIPLDVVTLLDQAGSNPAEFDMEGWLARFTSGRIRPRGEDYLAVDFVAIRSAINRLATERTGHPDIDLMGLPLEAMMADRRRKAEEERVARREAARRRADGTNGMVLDELRQEVAAFGEEGTELLAAAESEVTPMSAMDEPSLDDHAIGDMMAQRAQDLRKRVRSALLALRDRRWREEQEELEQLEASRARRDRADAWRRLLLAAALPKLGEDRADLFMRVRRRELSNRTACEIETQAEFERMMALLK